MRPKIEDRRSPFGYCRLGPSAGPNLTRTTSRWSFPRHRQRRASYLHTVGFRGKFGDREPRHRQRPASHLHPVGLRGKLGARGPRSRGGHSHSSTCKARCQAYEKYGERGEREEGGGRVGRSGPQWPCLVLDWAGPIFGPSIPSSLCRPWWGSPAKSAALSALLSPRGLDDTWQQSYVGEYAIYIFPSPTEWSRSYTR